MWSGFLWYCIFHSLWEILQVAPCAPMTEISMFHVSLGALCTTCSSANAQPTSLYCTLCWGCNPSLGDVSNKSPSNEPRIIITLQDYNGCSTREMRYQMKRLYHLYGNPSSLDYLKNQGESEHLKFMAMLSSNKKIHVSVYIIYLYHKNL